jgi:hypothetical protein
MKINKFIYILIKLTNSKDNNHENKAYPGRTHFESNNTFLHERWFQLEDLKSSEGKVDNSSPSPNPLLKN